MKILSAALFLLCAILGYRLINLSEKLDNVERIAKNESRELKETLQKKQIQFDLELDELHNYLLMQTGNMPPSLKEKIITSCETTPAVELDKNNISLAVSRKYSLLIPDADITLEQQQKLVAILEKRENLINVATSNYFTHDIDIEDNIQQREALLEQLDADIDELLNDDDYEAYTLLKDSGFEQYQLKQLDTELGEEQALDSYQHRQLLLSKLQHKQTFHDAVLEAKNMGEASGQSRQRLLQALDKYSENYYADIENSLSDLQMEALIRYESQQFSDMRKSLMAGYSQ